MKYLVVQGAKELEVEVHPAGEHRFSCSIGDETFDALARESGDGSLLLLIGDQVYDVAFEHRQKSVWGIRTRGIASRIQVLTPREAALRRAHVAAAGSDGWELSAPMPGKVTKILVAAGTEVKAGEALIVVEAMKMENELRAPADGMIGEILVSAGGTIEAGAVLVKSIAARGVAS